MSASEGELLLAVGSYGQESEDTAVELEVRRLQAGDMVAFKHLMQRHEPLVFRIGLRMLGNREDAMDAAQEVFLRLYRFREKLDPQRALKPWLYSMTLNVCRDAARKRSRWTKIPLPISASVENPAARRMDAALESQIVEEALMLLTERERAAVVLRDIEGLSTKEVAQTMCIREFTVRSLISRGRVKLRRYRDKKLENDRAL